MNLATARVNQLEILDGGDYGSDEYEATLRQIAVLNRWTGAYGPTLAAVAHAAHLARAAGVSRPLRVLDLGFGYGDTLRRLHEWSAGAGIALELSGLELNPEAARLARLATPQDMSIHYGVGNFLDGVDLDVDVIINSLFMHHLSDDEIVQAFRWMSRHARVAWFCNDLHRHAIPYHFIRWATRLFGFGRLVRHDAPLSVSRAFVREDWRRYVRLAGLSHENTRVRWHWPFRYGVFCDVGSRRA